MNEGSSVGGVVLADLLDHTTIALGARVGDDDAVVRRTDLAEALETDLDSHNYSCCVMLWLNGTAGVGAHTV